MSAQPPVGQAALLLAEVERLKHELEDATRRIAELEAHADVDPLLEILNRRGFERELKRSIAYVKRYGTAAALIYLDLDDFKRINDRHGHAAGDALLREVAKQLCAQVRASDVVGRLGGAEFVVLMWNAGVDQARVKARDLETAVAAIALPHGEAQLCVGASAGVAAVGPGDTLDTVIEAADRTMYARKRERR